MTSNTITLELPDPLYRSARRIADATKRPIEEIVQESLSHTLPPLDDVSSDEAELLARMSMFDDASLWQETNVVIPLETQAEFQALLNSQSADELKDTDKLRLQSLMDEYGRLLVRRLHAGGCWLVAANSVPVEQH